MLLEDADLCIWLFLFGYVAIGFACAPLRHGSRDFAIGYFLVWPAHVLTLSLFATLKERWQRMPLWWYDKLVILGWILLGWVILCLMR